MWRQGEAVHLTPKVWAVLRALTAQPGQFVPKAALLEAVWPDAVVSEAVLTECIRVLRQAFGETARAPRWIQTVHRRGYRFLGPVPEPVLDARGRLRRPGVASGRPLRSALARRAGVTRPCPPRRRPSLDARRSWRSCTSGWRRHGVARARWCLSPESRGWGRPRWSRPSWQRWQRWAGCGSRRGSVLNSMAREKPTCRSWRRSDGCVVRLGVRPPGGAGTPGSHVARPDARPAE